MLKVTNPYIFKLKNNLKVIFIPLKEVKAVYINYRVKAGSNYETNSQIGAAHLVEHLIMHKDKSLLTNQGGKVYGVTSRDECLFYIKTLKEHFETAIQYLANVLTDKEIEIGDVLTQKEIIKQEIKRVLNNPEKEIVRRSYATLYPNTRLAKLNTGEFKDIDKLELEEIENFLNTHYTTDNSIVVIAGDLSNTTVGSVTQKYLVELPQVNRSLTTDIDFTPATINTSDTTVNLNIIEEEHTQKYIKIDYYAYPLKDKNRYAARYLETLLDNYLNQEFRYKKSLVYKIHAMAFSSNLYGTFSIYTIADNKDLYKDILKLMEYNNLKQIVDTLDLEIVKNNILSEFIFEIERPSNLVSFYSENHLFDNDITIEDEIENIKKVTIADILEVIKEMQKQRPNVTIIV
jgi:predicted Zn-dependent peptidase